MSTEKTSVSLEDSGVPTVVPAGQQTVRAKEKRDQHADAPAAGLAISSSSGNQEIPDVPAEVPAEALAEALAEKPIVRAKEKRDQHADAPAASLAISSGNQEIPDVPAEEPAEALAEALAERLTEEQADELFKFHNIESEMTDIEKVNNTLLIKQSEPKPLGLTEPDLNSLRKVVERLHSLRFQHRPEALARKFVHDTGASRHIICQKAFF